MVMRNSGYIISREIKELYPETALDSVVWGNFLYIRDSELD